MEILREGDKLPRCPYRLPGCLAPKEGALINIQAFDLWRRHLKDSLRESLSKTGYIINPWVDPETAKLSIEFTGDTYSKEHWPSSCITSNTKFVDKFSDLKPLDDALITKIWNNLIEFIGTLPQPGDHGYEAYKAIHEDYLDSVHAVRKAEDDLFRMKLANEDLSYEIQKLKQQLLEFASVKAQLAEVTTALKVVSGLNKN